MGDSCREPAAHGAQYQWGLRSAGQRRKFAKVGIVYIARNLGIHRPDTLKNNRYCFGPLYGVLDTDQHKTLSRHPGLPSSGRRKPPSHIDTHHRTRSGVFTNHGQPETGKSEPWRANQTNNTPWHQHKRLTLTRLVLIRASDLTISYVGIPTACEYAHCDTPLHLLYPYRHTTRSIRNDSQRPLA